MEMGGCASSKSIPGGLPPHVRSTGQEDSVRILASIQIKSAAPVFESPWWDSSSLRPVPDLSSVWQDNIDGNSRCQLSSESHLIEGSPTRVDGGHGLLTFSGPKKEGKVRAWRV